MGGWNYFSNFRFTASHCGEGDCTTETSGRVNKGIKREESKEKAIDFHPILMTSNNADIYEQKLNCKRTQTVALKVIFV